MDNMPYVIKNDDDYEAALIAIGLISYLYATPSARQRYDRMTEEEKTFLKDYINKERNKNNA